MRIIYISITVIMLLTLIASCTSPQSKPEIKNEDDVPPIPFEEIESKPDESKEKVINNTANDDNKNEVTLTPPKDIKPIKIADDSVEGYYVPTHDYFENLELSKFALIINEEDENKYSWILCQIIDGKHKNIGGGFFTKIEGGIDLDEYNLPGNTNTPTIFANEAIARERFPAEFKNNELHIVKAFESDGKSSISKLIENFGELYFVRIADSSENPMPTSQILGKFHTTNKITGEKISDSMLIIWSNGIWSYKTTEKLLLETANKSSKNEKTVLIKGSWSISDGIVTFKRTTKCALDSIDIDINNELPSESYNFVFDTENFILWLTLIRTSEIAPVGFNKYLSINETSIFLP